MTLAVGVLTAADSRAEHPNALWHVVHDLCVVDKRLTGLPAPCASVDLVRRWAVIGDPKRRTQFLLVPITPVVGIESPQLLAPDAPNYWQAAWNARRFVAGKLHRPIDRREVGLAVNSVAGRSQEQLHIHIDCVRGDVLAALDTLGPRVDDRWSALPVDLNGARYRAHWIEGEDLGDRNPFKILAEEDPAARAEMARETLVLVGATRPDGSPGFILLSARAAPENGIKGAGEDLLDHQCTAQRRSPLAAAASPAAKT